MAEPIVDKPEIPREYGNPTERLQWADNITHDPSVAVHIGDGHEAIIVEGDVEFEKPTQAMAARLSDASFSKYPQYGRIDPRNYMAGVSVVRPRRVLAWTSFTENATRFRFE